MRTFCLTGAKARLSRLVELVEAGEHVTITKRGNPVVRLVPAVRGRRVSLLAAVGMGIGTDIRSALKQRPRRLI